MNLFEIQERLKDFSKDQLVQEMQMPSGTAPPYLVLSELQRRTRMEQAMMADGQGAPQSTVAEDAVAAAGVPQGGLADMARAMAPQTDMTQNDAAAPVQMMAEGGTVEPEQTATPMMSNAAQVQNAISQVFGGAQGAAPMMQAAQNIMPMAAPMAPAGGMNPAAQALSQAAQEYMNRPMKVQQQQAPQVDTSRIDDILGRLNTPQVPQEIDPRRLQYEIARYENSRMPAKDRENINYRQFGLTEDPYPGMGLFGMRGEQQGIPLTGSATPQVSQTDLAYAMQNAPTLEQRQQALAAMQRQQAGPANPQGGLFGQIGNAYDRYHRVDGKAEGGVIKMQEGGSIQELLQKEQARPEEMTESEWRTLYGSNWATMRRLAIEAKKERGPASDALVESGLDRLEREREESALFGDDPEARASALDVIGRDSGSAIDELGTSAGRSALRQADALAAGATMLGSRAGEAGLGGLSAISSFLGTPRLGADMEEVAAEIRRGRGNIARGSGEGMPMNLSGPQLLTRGMTDPGFQIPQEARNMYTEAEVMRRLESLPQDSPVFAEGSVTEPLRGDYDFPSSTGVSPRGQAKRGVDAEFFGIGPGTYDREFAAPDYSSGLDSELLQIGTPGLPPALTEYDVSTGVPLSPREMDIASLPSQADLDMRYAETPAADRFPGEDRIDFERQGAAEARVPLEAFGGAGERERLPEPETPLQVLLGATGREFVVNPLMSGISAVGNAIPGIVESGRELKLSDLGEGFDRTMAPISEAINPIRRFLGAPEEIADAVSERAAELRGPGETAGEPLQIPEDVSDLIAPLADREGGPDAERTTTPDVRTTPPTGPRGPAGGGTSTGASGSATSESESAGGDNSSKWLALARFGLGLMQSQQPTLGGAIGEAGMGALDELRTLEDREYERDMVEREFALKQQIAAMRGRGGGGSGSDAPGLGLSTDIDRGLGALQARLDTLKASRAGMDEGGLFRGEDPRIEETDALIQRLEQRRDAILDLTMGGGLFTPGSTAPYNITDVR